MTSHIPPRVDPDDKKGLQHQNSPRYIRYNRRQLPSRTASPSSSSMPSGCNSGGSGGGNAEVAATPAATPTAIIPDLPSPLTTFDVAPVTPTITRTDSQDSLHSFLHVHFEPSLTATLFEVLELFAQPNSSDSIDIPSTPPPLYEPPPPTYSDAMTESLCQRPQLLPSPSPAPSLGSQLGVHRSHSCASWSLYSSSGATNSGFGFVLDDASSTYSVQHAVSETLQSELDLHLAAYEELTKALRTTTTAAAAAAAAAAAVTAVAASPRPVYHNLLEGSCQQLEQHQS